MNALEVNEFKFSLKVEWIVQAAFYSLISRGCGQCSQWSMKRGGSGSPESLAISALHFSTTPPTCGLSFALSLLPVDSFRRPPQILAGYNAQFTSLQRVLGLKQSPHLSFINGSSLVSLPTMSFGYGFGEIIGVSQLAYQVVANCRKACGEHDVLTRDVTSLHVVLRRLESEVQKPESLLNRPDDSSREKLNTSTEGCTKILSVLDQILEKYNALSEDKRAGKRLWSKIRFGNGEMQDLSELRVKISTYTSAITLQLNLISMGSQGRVERQISEALPEFRESLNWITAKLSMGNEGSILTSYNGDDKAVWKELRRELVLEGFASPHIQQHKATILSYIKELGDRGVLDESEQIDVLDKTTGMELSASTDHAEESSESNEAKNEALDGKTIDAKKGLASLHNGQDESFFDYLRKRPRRFSVRQPPIGPFQKLDTHEALDKPLRNVQDVPNDEAQLDEEEENSVALDLKGKMNKVEDAGSTLPTVEKFDAFHEIKLDDTGPILDLKFGVGTVSTKLSSGFGARVWSWDTEISVDDLAGGVDKETGMKHSPSKLSGQAIDTLKKEKRSGGRLKLPPTMPEDKRRTWLQRISALSSLQPQDTASAPTSTSATVDKSASTLELNKCFSCSQEFHSPLPQPTRGTRHKHNPIQSAPPTSMEAQARLWPYGVC